MTRGFTLVEVVITLAIVALAAGVAIPAINNLTRADLRRSARMLSSTIQQTYEEAALTGQMQRIVFVLGTPTASGAKTAGKAPGIKIEAAEQALLFDPSGGALVSASRQAEALDALEPPPFFDGDDTSTQDAVAADAAAQKPPSKSAQPKGMLGHLADINKLPLEDEEDTFHAIGTLKLEGDVHVRDVWLEGMPQPLTHGEVALLFFAHGYTQKASIHLEDGSQNIFTITVQPLTGRTQILDGYIESHK